MAVITKSTEAATAIPEFWLNEAIGALKTMLMFANLVRDFRLIEFNIVLLR